MIKSHSITDLWFGHSGKGKCVDWLARQLPNSKYVIKYNGDAECTHTVVLPNGFAHTFAQFGSGVFSDKSTYLTKYFSIDPISILSEHEHLSAYLGESILSKLYINLDCKVITPYHQALNRFKESRRGTKKHDQCRIGYGPCIQFDMEVPELTIHYRDLNNPIKITNMLNKLRKYILGHYPYIEDFEDFKNISGFLSDIISMYAELYEKTVSVNEVSEHMILSQPDNIFEGSQGVMMDETFGCNPYTTRSNCTTDNIHKLYKKYEDIVYDLNSIGIFRTYPIQDSIGPFPSEMKEPVLSILFDDHNVTNEWHDDLRLGYLDIPLLKYAISKCPVDSFIITHFDKVQDDHSVITDYYIPEVTGYHDSFNLTVSLSNIEHTKFDTVNRENLIQYLENVLSVDCFAVSDGQTYEHIKLGK